MNNAPTTKRKVKAFVFLYNESEDKADVILEDGGYAYCYGRHGGPNNEFCLVSNLHSDRFTKGLTVENFEEQMDRICEDSTIYHTDWDGTIEGCPLKENADDAVVDDMIDWLYQATDEYEIEKIVFNSRITDELLAQVIPQLVLED